MASNKSSHTRTEIDLNLDKDDVKKNNLNSDDEATYIGIESEPALEIKLEPVIEHAPSKISQEPTLFLQRNSVQIEDSKLKKWKDFLKIIVFSLILGALGYDTFLKEEQKPSSVRFDPIRPSLPNYIKDNTDAKKSIQLYSDAIPYYLSDNVEGYSRAATLFKKSIEYDVSNVKALAMLASSYINLIDSSNKDENYFSVISKLIEMSRAKSIDLPETVIADVEFYIVVNKAEAAGNRIVEYTKAHEKYGLEMFYYLGLAFYARGDTENSAKYLGQFPDNKIYSAKIYYLRGIIAEKLNDDASALIEFKKAIAFNPRHAKSYLKLSQLKNKTGHLKETAPYLDFILKNTHLLSPRDLGLAYYLHAQLSELEQNWDIALGDMERALKIDPDNHNYLLEYYTLRGKSEGKFQSVLEKEKVQEQARMYYFLGEGENLLGKGRYQDAIGSFLQAREASDSSPLPLVKMGDMFTYLHNAENAKLNYKLASVRAPNNIQVWSKYINSLIQSYEWEEATQAMEKFRKLPISQSSIDKAAADMYQKQGRYIEAQTFYKKAMGRDSIDPDVYIAYAKSLMSTKNYKDAPFFFALALRFDPLNLDAIVSTSKCIAETESIDRGISMLQDELQKGSGARAEFLSAIAELQIQKGDWGQAQSTIDQARLADPESAYTWKIQAQIYQNRENSDKTALDKALMAYKSYSDRNPSDPSGYLERYKIFLKKLSFDKAKEELDQIFSIYPRYPNLHFYFGTLYSIQGNHKVAAEEFKKEIENNPNNVQTLIAYGKEKMDLGQSNADAQEIQDALNQFTKAMRIAPTSSDAKQNAGWANYQLKNFQAAIALLKAAIDLDRANPTLYRRLGIIYRDLSDTVSACDAFKKYLEMEPDASDKSEFQFCK